MPFRGENVDTLPFDYNLDSTPNDELKMALPAWTPHGIPVTLASSISECSEGLPWFSVFEGAVSSKEKILKGLRTDGTRNGEHLGDTSVCLQLCNTSSGSSTTFGLRSEIAEEAMRARRSIGVIIGHKHPSLQGRDIRLSEGERFALLGIFILTDTWVEWQNDTKLLIAKLEVVSTDAIWWVDPATRERLRHQRRASGEVKSLGGNELQAGEEIRRYKDGPLFCGRLQCPLSNDKKICTALPIERRYHDEYLSSRTNKMDAVPLDCDFVPAVPTQPTKEEVAQMSEQNNNKRPNRLACRNCGQSHGINLPEFTFDELVDSRWLNLQNDTEIPQILVKEEAGIQHTTSSTDMFKTHRFELVDNNIIIIAYPKRRAIEGPDGTRDLFDRAWKAAQKGGIPLQRCRTKAKIEYQLTAWFGCNYGQEYLTRMTTQTTTFASAPDVVNAIRVAITAFSSQILGQDVEFNEMLTIGNYPKWGWAGMMMARATLLAQRSHPCRSAELLP
ncbi:Uu.00g056150.m01.CDS01 [Anthostomella pinea]|uniref:Uu.00g056150.m01.CDS01 n=1 Tax=Anthostomella pinea TaxID=933095 RepID=A0AAI8VKW7_9PEZI|nr:Uu.00g056150.m01.CDS01 [Anthostomella pinea]